MKTVNTAVALLAASLLLSACGRKEEAAPAADVAPPPAVEPPPAPEPAPAPVDDPAVPADNADDAEQSGGDKVKPPS